MPENNKKKTKIKNGSFLSVRALVCCAMMVAVAVVLARLMSVVPDETSRFSIESIPIFISGMLFGPIAGAIVGFISDLIGCLMSPFGYNPLLCLPPVLCGLLAGLFQKFLVKKFSIPRLSLAFLPYILFGCILWQSLALALVYGGDAKLAFFLAKLGTRSIQYAITYIIDVTAVWLLFKSKVFTAAKLWPPAK